MSADGHIPVPKAPINCPLCEWHYDVPPLDSRIGPDTLAGVFGPGIMFQHALNSQTQKTEEELRRHLATHKLEEWVARVTQLQRELQIAQAALDGAFV